MTHHKDAAMEVLKSAPPVAVTTATLAGMPLNEWVFALTILWLCCQIGGWVWDRFFKEKQV